MSQGHRKLAAIVAADVAGYSRLMGADEEGTLAALKAHRATLIDPAVARHGGRIVKTTGDGLLLEFPSVVDAVRRAVAVQQGVAAHNTAVAQDRRLQFRVGVHLGDVIVDGEDIFGDGVNVAARLEALAAPGGLCLSNAAYEQVRDRLDVAWADGGIHEVKNIARPIQVWLWRNAAGTPEPASAAAPLPLPEKPSIAVLPFANMSGDPEQEFFADGMAEDIITALSRMPWFFVIARNSTFTYKDRGVDVKQVAAELGVAYVLEGSVRKSGSRLRITAQLIDATSGKHVWAERYDREITDIFQIQDEVTEAIVGAIAPEFLAVEAKRVRRKDPAQLDAWECVMRGRAHLWKLGRADAAEARAWFERAIELAPGGEFGTSDLALVHFLESYYRWSRSPQDSLAHMMVMAEKAVAADDQDPVALTVLAWANAHARRWDEILPAVERAIAISPNFASAIGIKGSALALLGRPDEAIETIDEAFRLSPRDGFAAFWFMGLFWAHFSAGRYEAAADTAQRAIRLSPNNPTFRRQLAAACARLDRMDEARTALHDYLSLEPNHTLADVARVPSSVPEHVQRFVEALRRAGMPE